MWKLSTQALPSRQLVLSVRIREACCQVDKFFSVIFNTANLDGEGLTVFVIRYLVKG